MIKTLSPYSTASAATSKTEEIMSRYRPIAPKPESVSPGSATSDNSPTSMSPKIRQSPYLRNLWPQLQARPTRTRKRGRSAAISPPTIHKRPKTALPTVHHQHQAFSHGGLSQLIPFGNQMENSAASTTVAMSPRTETTTATRRLVTLPLLPCSPELNCMDRNNHGDGVVDTDSSVRGEVPEEKDLLRQLAAGSGNVVITPQPVRPVCSSISVGGISELATVVARAKKLAKEVEEEVESEALPAVVSDSHNRVRLANSAYKEMVGQPECGWLESMAANVGRRIGGEVAIRMCGDEKVPVWADRFSCWVRIEWGSQGKKKGCVKAFCDAIKLCCDSKDYLFSWRFHITNNNNSSSSNKTGQFSESSFSVQNL